MSNSFSLKGHKQPNLIMWGGPLKRWTQREQEGRTKGRKEGKEGRQKGRKDKWKEGEKER